MDKVCWKFISVSDCRYNLSGSKSLSFVSMHLTMERSGDRDRVDEETAKPLRIALTYATADYCGRAKNKLCQGTVSFVECW